MECSLPIEEQIAANLDIRGYKELTPIQNEIIKNEATGRDALVSAPTGSGKTIAFGLSIASNIPNKNPNNKFSKLSSVLIIAPTRELALQVENELEWLYSKTNVFIVSALTSKTSMLRALESQLFLFATPDFKAPKTICCSPGLFPKKVGPTSNNEISK